MNFHPTNASSKAARRARRGRIAAANAAPRRLGAARRPSSAVCGHLLVSYWTLAARAECSQHRTFIVLPHPPSICMEQETSLPPSALALICETLLPLFATFVVPASLPNANLKGLP